MSFKYARMSIGSGWLPCIALLALAAGCGHASDSNVAVEQAALEHGRHHHGHSGACVERDSADTTCDGVDDDCDGKVDEDAVSACAQIILNGESDCVPTGTSASCVLLRCNDGFDNCDGNPANGCEPYCACHDCSDSGTEEDAH
jgi:hypothetical protein